MVCRIFAYIIGFLVKCDDEGERRERGRERKRKKGRTIGRTERRKEINKI